MLALDSKTEESDIYRLAREIAAKTGESAADAIPIALEERLERLSGQERKTAQREKVNDILRRVDTLPRDSILKDDEILGYDERGLPR